jgi:hypothetical protein
LHFLFFCCYSVFIFFMGKILVGSIAAVQYKPIGVVITILEKSTRQGRTSSMKQFSDFRSTT